MAQDTPSPSFSRRRKWRIGFNVALGAIAAFAVVVMINYFSSHYFRRFYLASNQRVALSPRTLAVLDSLTNKVEITLYYSKDEDIYSTLVDLLHEYQAHSRRLLSVRFVDYVRDAAVAQELSQKYKLGSETNLVIFDCAGRPPQIIPGDLLMQNKLEPVASDDPNKLAYRRKPEAFRGELLFTGALLAATDPTPLKAYFLQGNGEHDPDGSDNLGYSSFAGILEQNFINVKRLWLVGTNGVPPDCNLLIVAGATTMSPSEVETIDRYLTEGGRLFALFNLTTTNTQSGLAKELRRWGVNVGDVVIDPVFTSAEAPGNDVLVIKFSRNSALHALTGQTIQMIRPREVSKRELPPSVADTRRVDEIAFTGPQAYLANETPSQGRTLPLMASVEDAAPKERGTTRILVMGDSLFLTNTRIESGANRELVGLAANWLLNRDILLKGIGPQPVTEYRLLMTKSQMQNAKWILLAAMPGGILLLGGLVWLRRRR